MTYEELRKLVSGYNPQDVSYEDIISAIQGQYRPQTQFIKTPSLLETIGEQLPEEKRIAYGSLLQSQPKKAITPIDISKYKIASDGTLSDGTSNSGGGDTSTSGPTNIGFSINSLGQAVPNTNSNIAATIAGLVTGLPIGLMNTINNSINTSAANSFNAAVADSVNESSGPVATTGPTGTGGVAAAAASAAASAVSSMGGSDAAAAAAGQAAANAAIGGMSQGDAVSAGVAAGVAADGGVGAPSGVGDGVGDGSAFAKGGLVTMDRLMGSNPMGQDDGYASLQHGEYVIKKDAVDKYGEDFLGLLNSGKITKKQINSLL